MSRTARLLLVLALALPTVATAALRTDGKPKVSFFATGSPGFLDIEGTSGTLSTVDDGTTLTFSVPMSTVTTGIGLRDDHMNNEYVDVAHFPNAVMKVARNDVKWPGNVGEKTTGSVSGDFNVHGQGQAVTVSYTNVRTAKGFKVTAMFKFDAGKSGIVIPSYMGVTVDSKMSAQVTTELADAG